MPLFKAPPEAQPTTAAAQPRPAPLVQATPATAITRDGQTTALTLVTPREMQEAFRSAAYQATNGGKELLEHLLAQMRGEVKVTVHLDDGTSVTHYRQATVSEMAAARDILITRLMGKAPDIVQVQGHSGGPVTTANLTAEVLLEQIDRLNKVVEGAKALDIDKLQTVDGVVTKIEAEK